MKITLPVVIYELIGDMAGDIIYKLVFRMTKKRKELSSQVRIECRHSGQSYPLYKHTWKQGQDLEESLNYYFRYLEDDYYLERSDTFELQLVHFERKFKRKFIESPFHGFTE